jgi:ribosomal subunit interface protein
MTLRVSGKNVDIGESLRTHVVGRTREAVEKHYAGTFAGHVTVEREGSGFRAETALHLSSGVTLQAVGTSSDPYHACDQAILRIERRLQRYKRKLKDVKGGPSAAGPTTIDANSRSIESPVHILELPPRDLEEVPEDYAPVVVAEDTATILSRTVSEAVMDLDLTDKPFVVFRNAGHGGINVVFRRHDGHVGWIDPTLPTG